jgi:hypothetical protein
MAGRCCAVQCSTVRGCRNGRAGPGANAVSVTSGVQLWQGSLQGARQVLLPGALYSTVVYVGHGLANGSCAALCIPTGTVWCCIVLVPCNAVQYNTVLYSTEQFTTVLYCALRYRTLGMRARKLGVYSAAGGGSGVSHIQRRTTGWPHLVAAMCRTRAVPSFGCTKRCSVSSRLSRVLKFQPAKQAKSPRTSSV